MDSDKDGNIDGRFLDLCRNINMEKPIYEHAWQSFREMKTKYTLEGDNLHWLVCSLYSACRKQTSTMQSVSGHAVKGSLVSLNALLNNAKFSFTSFLKKMTTWLEMNTDEQLKEHIALLECNFRVSTNVFKKYSPIFLDVFRHCEPTSLEKSLKATQRTHRTHRNMTCSSDDVFKFCWMLFIHAKGTECQAISGEVLTSFQLLLCAVNLCFKNALGCSHRSSLLNPHFPGLPDGWDDNGYAPADNELPDIIHMLVQRHVGAELSTEEIQQFTLQTQVLSTHTWRKYISNLHQSDIDGAPNHIFRAEYFERNSKKMNRLYEEYILTEGDFDERVFLHEDVDNQLGTPIKMMGPNAVTNGSIPYPSVPDNHGDNPDIRLPRTPLTNREYLVGKERQSGIPGVDGRSFSMPASSIRNSDAHKLKKMLVGSKTMPSSTLLNIFKSCSEPIQTQINERLKVLCEQFMQAYSEGDHDEGSSASTADGVADQRLVLTKMMYFHMLEKIALQEKKRLSGRSDLTQLLKRDDFNNLLFTCCLEIILCCMDSRRSFPWALEALDISPYYFYKIVELVIRAEESLSGSIIKHLIYVEEQILEQLAWKADSPLWEAMNATPGTTAPLCQEVNFSYNIEGSSTGSSISSPRQIHPATSISSFPHPVSRVITSSSTSGTMSPLPHPRVKAVVGGDVMIRKAGTSHTSSNLAINRKQTLPIRVFRCVDKLAEQSKDASSAQDRFCSPSAGSAKRRLTFNRTPVVTSATTTSPDTSSTPVISLITTSTSSLVKKRIVMTPLSKDSAVKNGKTFVINNTGAKCTNITLVTTVPSKSTPSIISTTTNNIPVTGVNDCKPKKTGSLALFWRKIYHLACVRLRHLCEQLSITSELPQKIWTCFEHSISMNKAGLMRNRHIDQLLMCAVYVMAKVSRHEQSFQEIMRCYRNQPQATSNVYRNVLITSRRGVDGREDEERDDLIQFYNKIYVPLMREYVKKFSNTNDPNKKLEVPCSPMPRQRSIPQSPKRVSNHNVYISPMKTRPCVSPSSHRLEYNFQRSPSKNLRQINLMLQSQSQNGNGKRALPFSNGGGADSCDPPDLKIPSRPVVIGQSAKALSFSNGSN